MCGFGRKLFKEREETECARCVEADRAKENFAGVKHISTIDIIIIIRL